MTTGIPRRVQTTEPSALCTDVPLAVCNRVGPVRSSRKTDICRGHRRYCVHSARAAPGLVFVTSSKRQDVGHAQAEVIVAAELDAVEMLVDRVFEICLQTHLLGNHLYLWAC